MLNATLVRVDELLPTDTIFIGNFRYAVTEITDHGDGTYTVMIDTGYAQLMGAGEKVWILERLTEESTTTGGPCPITQVTDCRSRQCELHYMDAPILLGPGECPACLGPRDHLPLTGTCTDVLAGMGAIQ